MITAFVRTQSKQDFNFNKCPDQAMTSEEMEKKALLDDWKKKKKIEQ